MLEKGRQGEKKKGEKPTHKHIGFSSYFVLFVWRKKRKEEKKKKKKKK